MFQRRDFLILIAFFSPLVNLSAIITTTTIGSNANVPSLPSSKDCSGYKFLTPIQNKLVRWIDNLYAQGLSESITKNDNNEDVGDDAEMPLYYLSLKQKYAVDDDDDYIDIERFGIPSVLVDTFILERYYFPLHFQHQVLHTIMVDHHHHHLDKIPTTTATTTTIISNIADIHATNMNMNKERSKLEEHYRLLWWSQRLLSSIISERKIRIFYGGSRKVNFSLKEWLMAAYFPQQLNRDLMNHCPIELFRHLYPFSLQLSKLTKRLYWSLFPQFADSMGQLAQRIATISSETLQNILLFRMPLHPLNNEFDRSVEEIFNLTDKERRQYLWNWALKISGSSDKLITSPHHHPHKVQSANPQKDMRSFQQAMIHIIQSKIDPLSNYFEDNGQVDFLRMEFVLIQQTPLPMFHQLLYPACLSGRLKLMILLEASLEHRHYKLAWDILKYIPKYDRLCQCALVELLDLLEFHHNIKLGQQEVYSMLVKERVNAIKVFLAPSDASKGPICTWGIILDFPVLVYDREAVLSAAAVMNDALKMNTNNNVHIIISNCIPPSSLKSFIRALEKYLASSCRRNDEGMIILEEAIRFANSKC